MNKFFLTTFSALIIAAPIAKADMTYIKAVEDKIDQLLKTDCVDNSKPVCPTEQKEFQCKQYLEAKNAATDPMMRASYEQSHQHCIQSCEQITKSRDVKECNEIKNAAAASIRAQVARIEQVQNKGSAGVAMATHRAGLDDQQALAGSGSDAAAIVARAKEMQSQIGREALSQASKAKQDLLVKERQTEKRVVVNPPVAVLSQIEALGQAQLARDMKAAQDNIKNAQQMMGLMKQLGSMFADKGGAGGKGGATGASRTPPPSTVNFGSGPNTGAGSVIGGVKDTSSSGTLAGAAGSGAFNSSGASRAPASASATGARSLGALGTAGNLGSGGASGSSLGAGGLGGGSGSGGSRYAAEDGRKPGAPAVMNFDGGISGGSRTAMLGLSGGGSKNLGFAPKSNFGKLPDIGTAGEVLPENEAERGLASNEGGVNDGDVSLFNATRIKLQEYQSRGLLFSFTQQQQPTSPETN